MRNISIEYGKILAAFSVVMIHSALFFKANDINTGLIWFCSVGTGFAVPFFFITTGFFMAKGDIKKSSNNYFIKLSKLFILITLIIYILNFISVNFLNSTFSFNLYTQWYFIAILTILLLTINRNKKWLIFLFTMSISFSLLSNTLFPSLFAEPLIEVPSRNNFLSFMWVYIAGIFLYSWYEKHSYNQIISIILLIIALVLEILNYQIFYMAQFNIIPILIAFCLFIALLNLDIKVAKDKVKKLNYVYLDVFIFHVIYVGIFYNSYFKYPLEYPNLLLIFFVTVSFFMSILTGILIRKIDKSGFIYN